MLKEELRSTDKRRVERTKYILLDYFLAEKAKALTRVKMVDASIQYIKNIKPEKDAEQFSEILGRCNFDLLSCSTKPRAKVAKLIYKDVIK